jgi:hypothetical protein
MKSAGALLLLVSAAALTATGCDGANRAGAASGKRAISLDGMPGGLGTLSSSEFMVKPWHRVSTKPSRRYLSKDCPTPRAVLP